MSMVDAAIREGADAWHALPVDDVGRRLATSTERGLTPEDAAERLELHGPNRIDTGGATPWHRVLARQFTDVLIVILFVAAAVSLALGETVDAVTILAIIVLNAVMGFVQEWKAERAIEALAEMLALRAEVIRGGHQRSVAADELVPGDVVVFAAGTQVPADLRLSAPTNVEADESSLTGESIPIAKAAAPVAADTPLAERRSMAWMGTTITAGHGLGLVVATGTATQFGRIAELTRGVSRETTPLQRQLASLGKLLGAMAVTISAAVTVVGLIRGNELLDMLLTGVSLAVAAVPEGLPAVVTITLALGVRAMAQQRALVRRLPAAETLGSATVICTDKTGTITENEMTVQEAWAGGQMVPSAPTDDGNEVLRRLLLSGLICSHARIEGGDGDGEKRVVGEPTETALVKAALGAGLSRPRRPVARELSFTSGRKRMTVIIEHDEGLVAHMKGAPEVVLDRCEWVLTAAGPRSLTEDLRNEVMAAQHTLAARGLRTLAVASRELSGEEAAAPPDEVERSFVLLGMVGILDPPRPEVPEAVASCRQAGVRVVMITGDAPATAGAVARLVGLEPPATITGGDVDRMNDGELRDAAAAGSTFARTTPEHKLRIVGALQDAGHVVAMTGDGVNDAPALKRADIGIAMGQRGTDVARGAADMVLSDDNFASIVGAVAEGRRQHDNLTKFVRYLLTCNVGEVIAIFVNIVLGGPLILLPVQILWMNLVTDGLSALALGMEPAEEGVMRRRPRRPRASIIGRTGGWQIAVLGSYIGLVSLLVFQLLIGGAAYERAQTMAFTTLVVLQLVNVFGFRATRAPLSRIGWGSNRWLLGAVGLSLALQLAAVYLPFMQHAFHTVPLGFADWLLIAGCSLPLLVGTEAVKAWRWRTAAR